MATLVQNLPSTAYDQTIDLSHNAAAQITARMGSNASYQWSPIAPGAAIPLSRDVEAVRATWKGDLIIKGVMTPEDAAQAIEIGAAGIVVSKHGDRHWTGRHLRSACCRVSSKRWPDEVWSLSMAAYVQGLMCYAPALWAPMPC